MMQREANGLANLQVHLVTHCLKMEKMTTRILLKTLPPTTKPVPVGLGEAIEGGSSGQTNIYSLESNFLVFPQDSCLVRDWIGSHREIHRRCSQILLLRKSNVLQYGFNISNWPKKNEAWASCVCFLEESLKAKLFANVCTPITIFFWLWDEALVICVKEEGRSLNSH